MTLEVFALGVLLAPAAGIGVAYGLACLFSWRR